MSSESLRSRLGKGLLEAAFIVFAVLVALGVDEYWEGLEEEELAETALDRIASEVRANKAELLNSRAPNVVLQGALGAAIEAIEMDEPFALTSIELDLSLLGDDAWASAQATRAVHYMDFDQVGRISRVYRVQELYLDQRAPAIDAIAALDSEPDDFLSFLRPFKRRLDVVLEVECDLLGAYDELLVELGGGDLETGPGPGCPTTPGGGG